MKSAKKYKNALAYFAAISGTEKESFTTMVPFVNLTKII
jgi:hypothetical protein